MIFCLKESANTIHDFILDVVYLLCKTHKLRDIDPLMGVLNSNITLFCACSARSTRFQIHLTFCGR